MPFDLTYMHTNKDLILEYLTNLPIERRRVVEILRKTITENIPKGFMETFSYGMIGFVVPHTIYPNGYHCDPKLPLPFLSISSKKDFIAIYHMGMYADKKLLNWFEEEYPKHCKTKLDMGKSCIRFKKIDQLPYVLIGELASKMSCKEWIQVYEETFKKG